ncbi:50S ribosomal protein L25 [uncultured Alphaproteobacteria bacterium]|uniref:Large ribosomal subunit protein bL25 n=1 Tax=uncultured Alphaproteobacteria bacterium TaxID=91750 RepID=A0A212JWH7_9PROT|nr:50S ribosomal protein L25 [uncultured Alphaproteobacteria bacterium]
MKSTTLTAAKRERAGKGAARAVRNQGLVPGVIYGDKQPPVLFSIDPRQLLAQMARPGFWTHQFEIDVDGEKTLTMCQDLQVHPVSDRPIHVDFLRITADSTVEVDVPVKFVNEERSPGIKRGGVLNVVRHEIEVVCKADAIPEVLIADLTGLDVGDSLHISAIALPNGVKPTIDRDFTVATIVAPSGLKSEEAATAETTETTEAKA